MTVCAGQLHHRNHSIASKSHLVLALSSSTSASLARSIRCESMSGLRRSMD
jgi:hypothetical protein